MNTLMDSLPQRHRITVDEYHRMAEVGLLAPDARVELIEGEIIDMAPIGKDHMSIVDQLNRLFVMAAGDAAIVRVGGSVRLGRMSEPQPDLLILRPSADFYRNEYATGSDTVLAIEVSDTTLRYDREIKMPLFARHGIPEAWIVDVQHDRLLIFTEPGDGAYRQNRIADRPERITLKAMPDLAVDLSALFPGN